MSNRLDPDQAQHFVGPDLGLICLQRLSTEILVIRSRIHKMQVRIAIREDAYQAAYSEAV